MKVESTTDYSKFRSVMGNRFINQTHVHKLIESISGFDYTPYNPILVNDQMYLIDGQHRLAALKHLGLPVHYVVVPNASLETVRTLNSSLRAWTLRDFVESYVKTGNEDYVTLLDFADDYGVPITTAAAILGGRNKSTGGGDVGKLIRNGLFEVRNLDNGKRLMASLKRIEPYTEGDVWISREFIRAFLLFMEKGGEPDKLVEQLEKRPELKIRREVDYRKYLLVLQDIYNFHQKKRLEII